MSAAEVEKAARELRHCAHVYHTAVEGKDAKRSALEQAARAFVAAEGGIGELAARAAAFGVNELSIGDASIEQLQALAALPGAETGRQPMQSHFDAGAWLIIDWVRVRHLGVTFAARRSYPATPADLEAVRQLWSVPK